MVNNSLTDAIDKHSDGKHVAYYFSGVCLIGAGVFCVISRVVIVRQQIKAQERHREPNSIELDER